MGDEGHVASLFPGTPELKEETRWVLPIRNSPKPPPERITLTFPAINKAREIIFLVSGPAKSPIVKEILKNPTGNLPAQRVNPPKGEVTWWLDQKAAHVPEP